MARFEKGQSGNPGGRPKDVGEVRELARQHTGAAINTLLEISSDKDAPHAARVSASSALLDRGWGRPQQGLSIGGDAENPLVLPNPEADAFIKFMFDHGATEYDIKRFIDGKLTE
jgi:hypothetical protein